MRFNLSDGKVLPKLYHAAEQAVAEEFPPEKFRELRTLGNVQALDETRDRLSKMRQWLLSQALDGCDATCIIEPFDRMHHEETCRYLPTEEQVQMVCESLFKAGPPIRWNDGATQPKLPLDVLCSRLPIPVDSQNQLRL